MKRTLINRSVNVVLILILGFFVVQRVPGWIRNFQMDGEKVSGFTALSTSGHAVELPFRGKRQVIVFWATWCGPCTLELMRFNSAVKDGTLAADDVIAISLGEDPKIVSAAALERDYRFTVLSDPESKTTLPVDGTPTVFHVDEFGVIQHASMGASVFPVWRAQWFLRKS